MKSLINNISVYRFFTNLFFVLFLSLFSPGFSQNQTEPEAPKSILLSEIATIRENITYKTNEKGNHLLLDIYIPRNASARNLPVLIYAHGGGWIKGDKMIRAESYIENTIAKLITKQYAVISMDYTLLNDSTHFPRPLEDTKDVIRWVRKNADQYNFDTNNIGLFGASAGAHLSLLAAYTPDNTFTGDPELSVYSAKVNYVIDHYGPTDLNKLFHTKAGKVPIFMIGLISKKIITLQENLVKGLSGYDIRKEQEKAIDYLKTISPVTYVANGVPTLIVQGNKDKVVPASQSKRLHRKLKKAKIQNSLVIVKNGLHGFRHSDKAYLDGIASQMVDFIISQKR